MKSTRIRKGVKLGRRTVNKSEQIRNIATMMVAEGKPTRPREIAEILDAKGIKVTSGQVSLALKGTPMALKHPIKLNLPDPSAALKQATLQELNKAEEFVRSIGSEEKAMVALVALGQLKREPTREQEYYGGA